MPPADILAPPSRGRIRVGSGQACAISGATKALKFFWASEHWATHASASSGGALGFASICSWRWWRSSPWRPHLTEIQAQRMGQMQPGEEAPFYFKVDHHF